MLTVAKRRLVLSPHLDDAVFSCFHVVAVSGEVDVATLFAGVPDAGCEVPRWDRITGARDSAERVRQRIEEDRQALALVGRVGRYLEFVEHQYVGVLPRVEELEGALGEISPSTEVFAPAGIGGHSAHTLVRELGLRLAARGWVTAFYADLPYATEFGWPAWAAGEEPDAFLDVDAAWRADAEPLYAGGWAPEAVTLADDLRERKLAAVRTYRTQVAALDAGPQQRLTHPELLRYEVVWRRS
jgi:LmbE family N-acetylglucosaminyl deacetylase